MRSKPFVIIFIAALVLLGVGVFVAMANSNTSSNSSQTSASQQTAPTVNTHQVEQSPDLANCIERVNKSDANQTIIEQSIQECHNQYGY